MQANEKFFSSLEKFENKENSTVKKSMPVTSILLNLSIPMRSKKNFKILDHLKDIDQMKFLNNENQFSNLSKIDYCVDRKLENSIIDDINYISCSMCSTQNKINYPTLHHLCKILCNDICHVGQSDCPKISYCNGNKYFEENNAKDGSIKSQGSIAEALTKTSTLTSSAAKRRLVARKIEFELLNNDILGSKEIEDKEYAPPKELLLYLVRMGSFNSAPKIHNSDTQDDTFEVPQGLSSEELLQHYQKMLGDKNRLNLLKRQFLRHISDETAIASKDISKHLQTLELKDVVDCDMLSKSTEQLRILQWNLLSQSLGQYNDGFICCPDDALLWDNRKYLIIEEILRYNPDIICLQEVDHFKFLKNVLGSQHYNGIFFPKPDSPCLYIEKNNGPDGCAIFYKYEKFNLINYETKILEIWHVQSNQVAIIANFQSKKTQKEFCICTTHLKARNGALLTKLRNEQGKDLLKFAYDKAQNRPLILCGDFNAEPIEPVYNTILNFKELNLSSAYAEIYYEELKKNDYNKKYKEIKCRLIKENTDTMEFEKQQINENLLTKAEILANYEPIFTTWKIREEGEICHTIDYIFYSKEHLKVCNCLLFPTENEIGKNRAPSLQYPSDHFSLVCDFKIL